MSVWNWNSLGGWGDVCDIPSSHVVSQASTGVHTLYEEFANVHSTPSLVSRRVGWYECGPTQECAPPAAPSAPESSYTVEISGSPSSKSPSLPDPASVLPFVFSIEELAYQGTIDETVGPDHFTGRILIAQMLILFRII